MENSQIQAPPEPSPPPENTAALARPGSREEQLRKARELIRAGKGPINRWMRIPKRYQGKGLDNFVGFDRDIIEAKDALEHGESIFITGACGSGKTHLALGLLLEWLAWRWDGRNLRFNATFVSWVELLLQLKNGFNEGQSELSMIEPYTTLDLLVLDDLGAEKVSDWSREGCYVILDRRYRDMRQTIVTSNLNLGQISHNLDDRIASRLVEMAKVIKLEGTDYRLKKTEMAIFEAAVVRKRE